MISLNNLLPLAGAVLPSLYGSQTTIKPVKLARNKHIKFTYSFILSVFVVIFSSMSLHVNILSKELIMFGIITITVLHYIVMFGIGGVFLAIMLFNFFMTRFRNKDYFSKKPLYCINLYLTVTVIHLLYLESFYTVTELTQ